MYGFEQNDLDPNDTIPVRTLKVLLRLNLKPLQPKYSEELKKFSQASCTVNPVWMVSVPRPKGCGLSAENGLL